MIVDEANCLKDAGLEQERRDMEKHAQSFDVCIVCALYEEAEAVLDEFSTRCNASFLKEFSSMDRYEYRYTRILNNRGEPLTVLVTWLSDSGPIQAGLDLKPFLHEFRPRFVAMTGFCAGYKKKVKRGDLVIAQYAYFYEAGKIMSESGGLSRHLQEMKAAASTSQVLHYTRGFDGWKEPVRKMKSDRLKRQLKDTDEPHCIIAPMASGMAVRQDDPFLWLRENYDRNTVGLDMEAATFYQALRAVPYIHGLVVKGVCDHADMNKKDTYHDYAARASAVYLLFFIREYVTEYTMPRRDVPSSSNRAGPSEAWQERATEETMPSHDGPLPTNAAYWIDQGDVLCNQKCYEEALAAYERAIVLDEYQSGAYCKKGNVLLYLLRRYAEVIAVYDQASQLNPEFADVHDRKASLSGVYQQRGQEALASYQRVINLEPRNSEAYNCKGKVLFYLMRYEEALVAYEDAIALNPNFAEAYCGKGDTLSRIGRTSEAQQAYSKAEELAKGD